MLHTLLTWIVVRKVSVSAPVELSFSLVYFFVTVIWNLVQYETKQTLGSGVLTFPDFLDNFITTEREVWRWKEAQR
jgi:hypothetical protein